MNFSEINDVRHLRATSIVPPPPPPSPWKPYRDSLLLFACIIAYLCLGAFVMSRIEGWGFLEATQFAVVTLTTGSNIHLECGIFFAFSSHTLRPNFIMTNVYLTLHVNHFIA